MQVHIRNMSKVDIAQVGEVLYGAFNSVAIKHGYARKMNDVKEGRAWAWAIFRNGPRELLVAEVESRVVGICCLNPRGKLGGVGPVAVDPDLQGYGIGKQLMNALIRKAESLQSLRLFQEAYNPASFSMYYSLNFMPVASLLNLTLSESDKVQRNLDPLDNVSEVNTKNLDEVCLYDGPRSRLDRRGDIAYYANWGKIFVYRHQSEIRGYLACLPGSESVQLGPLLAEGEEEAMNLFFYAAKVFKNRHCQARVMTRDNVLVGTLEEIGFKIYSIDLLMVRGPWRPAQYIEAFGAFPEGA